jgi:hypothetical protein
LALNDFGLKAGACDSGGFVKDEHVIRRAGGKCAVCHENRIIIKHLEAARSVAPTSKWLCTEIGILLSVLRRGIKNCRLFRER